MESGQRCVIFGYFNKGGGRVVGAVGGKVIYLPEPFMFTICATVTLLLRLLLLMLLVTIAMAGIESVPLDSG